MTPGDDDAPMGLGRGRTLAQPGFPADDGSADPAVRAALAAAPSTALARTLRGTRLLASVLAIADERDPDGGDKSSHMAVVSMLNERGERGLLAFSGTDALAAWHPEGRPVPALGRDVARSALDDAASAVVIDVAGPARVVITGSDLLVMADTLDVEAVRPHVLAVLAPLTSDGWVDLDVSDARGSGIEADVLVGIALTAGAHPDGRSAADLAGQAARILAASADLARLVPGGIALALADAGVAP